LKILILSTCYPKRDQPNSGIFIHRQVRALADLGAECHVIQPLDWFPPAPLHRLHPGWQSARSQGRGALDRVEGIPVHHPWVYHPKPSRFFPGDYWERVGRSVGLYISRRRELRSADVIYAQFLCHEGYAGLLAARRLNMPLVAIARGDDVHAWPERWADRRQKLATVLSGADGLLACSTGLARDAAAWATEGLAVTFEVVYNGVDLNRFSPAAGEAGRRESRDRLGLPKDRRLLLSVGTNMVAKGWLDLLDAFASLGREADGWDIVSVGVQREGDGLDLAAEAGGRGLGGRVHRLGRLSPDEMPPLYRAADIFVLASHNEGLSNSLVEAMAAGLPVVATDVGGHSELIDDGETGRLVPARDVDALAAALRELLGDERRAARLGDAARRGAARLGSHRENAARLLSYFENVLAPTYQAVGAAGIVV
jgi:glycosyltransferase involved in cell wall biosynthesis